MNHFLYIVLKAIVLVKGHIYLYRGLRPYTEVMEMIGRNFENDS
jgi:hypothetical protein